MKKYSTDKATNGDNHWKYCMANDIPFVRIIPATKFADIEFDVYPMLSFSELTKAPSDFVLDMYKVYAEFFRLPDNKFKCSGGSNNLIFTVYKEHAEFFASQLFDYLNEFVKSNRKEIKQL